MTLPPAQAGVGFSAESRSVVYRPRDRYASNLFILNNLSNKPG
jgi:hypothetical protein